jgi:uncharacterized protein
MNFRWCISFILFLSSGLVCAGLTDVSSLVSKLSHARSEIQPSSVHLDQLRHEISSHQEMLKLLEQNINQLAVDNKNIQFDLLTQELLISNYQEKLNLYVDLLAQLNSEKADLESSQDLLQQQLEEAKLSYDQLLLEVDARKLSYLSELSSCQIKRNHCLENSTVKRFQTAWNNSSDQLKAQTELISDLGELYHHNMSKISKIKNDEIQYQDSVKQYDIILKQHQSQLAELVLKKSSVVLELETTQKKQSELAERNKLLNASLVTVQEELQAKKILIVNLETELLDIQRKLNRDYKEFSTSINDMFKTDLAQTLSTQWQKNIEIDLKNHLLETSKKLVINQSALLLQEHSKQLVINDAKELLKNDIEPIMSEMLQEKILEFLSEQKPEYLDVMLAFRTQIFEQLKRNNYFVQIKDQLSSSITYKIINLGQLIAREGINTVSENLEQRLSQLSE